MTLTKEQRENYIRALLEERRGYVLHGLDDRVAEVDAELARVGASAEPPAKRAATRKKQG
jgi:hypothetical protein